MHVLACFMQRKKKKKKGKAGTSTAEANWWLDDTREIAREFATQQKQLEDHTRAMHAPLLITDVESHKDKDGGGERGEIMMNR